MSAKRLPDDPKADARKARANGWHVDADSWWTRHRRKGDIEITECRKGGTTSHFGFTSPRRVYVRSAAFALSYDRGKVTPYRAHKALFRCEVNYQTASGNGSTAILYEWAYYEHSAINQAQKRVRSDKRRSVMKIDGGSVELA